MSRPIDPLLDPRRNPRTPSGSARPAARPSGQGRALPPPLPPSGATARPTSAAGTSPRVPQRPAGKRKGPARGSKIASLAVSISTTLGLAALFAQQDTTSAAATDPLLDAAATGVTPTSAAVTAGTTSPATVVTLDPASTGSTVAPTPTTAAATGGIVDGTYLGTPSTNKWGTVQVQAVYSGGSLVDVQILSYPDRDRKSVAINQRSLPSMINDAISIQSADVAHISGATYTWKSYKVSLQSAIDSARSASGLA